MQTLAIIRVSRGMLRSRAISAVAQLPASRGTNETFIVYTVFLNFTCLLKVIQGQVRKQGCLTCTKAMFVLFTT